MKAMSKIKSFIIAFFAIVVLILPLTGCTAGNSGQTFTVTFAQDGESDIVRTVRNGERISDVPAPAGGDGETVIEWNFDFDKPVVKSATVGVISYTRGTAFDYADKNENSYSVIGFTGSPVNLELPDDYKGLPVTEIGAAAFSAKSTLKTVRLPSGLKKIGDNAFWECAGLIAIDLPDTVESLGAASLQGCTGLRSFTLPSRITKVPARLTVGHRYSFIEVPEGVTSIEPYAFASEITKIVLPLSLGKIDYVGLWKNLKEIYYRGTKDDWGWIDVSDEVYNGFSSASVVKNATIYYYSETRPTGVGNYWRYVGGTPTKWQTAD